MLAEDLSRYIAFFLKGANPSATQATALWGTSRVGGEQMRRGKRWKQTLEIIEPKPSYYQSPDGSYSFPNGKQGPRSSGQKVRYQAGFKGSYYTLTLKPVYDNDMIRHMLIEIQDVAYMQ